MASSLTATNAPPDSRTARRALRQLRGWPTSMLSASVRAGPGTTSRPSRKASTSGRAPSACTPSIRGRRSTSPSARISCRPFQVPAMVQPSPTETATQSGRSSPACSPISRPHVFFPSTSEGFTAALRLYQPWRAQARWHSSQVSS